MSARAVAGVTIVMTWTVVAIVTSCRPEAAIMQVRERDASWSAPPAARLRANPLQHRQEAAAGGGKLFEQRCATCHGEDGHGTSKAPDLTQPDVQAQSDGTLFWKISSGNTHAGMPAFSFLPELQRWQLVLHLRAAGTELSEAEDAILAGHPGTGDDESLARRRRPA
jgi:mono/diheme cytochrome c family protein